MVAEMNTPKLPPLPKPDTHCFDEDTGKDVWSHSPEQTQAYALAAIEALWAQLGQGVPTDEQIMATVQQKGFGFSQSRPLAQQWDQVCELIRAVVRERNTHPAPQVAVVQQEPVGVVGEMPGTSGFTMACFHADKVPVGSNLYTHPAPQQKPLTDEQITAGAKALCKRSSEICGVNADDNWNLESEYFKDDARCVLEAAHNIGEKK